MLELLPALCVPGMLVTARHARIDDEERGVLGDGNPPVLERRAVEQDRRVALAEHARRLVEDAAGNADGAELRPPACLRELERLELELGDRTEGECDADLERR